MEVDEQRSPDADHNVLDTVQGEIAFFRAMMAARPVGMHRHFHALSIAHAVKAATGAQVTVDNIWVKLRECYNLELLEQLEGDVASGPSTPEEPRSPSPSENLARHPFFRSEFTLPDDKAIEDDVIKRRMRESESPPSSPTSAGPARGKAPSGRGRKKGKTKGRTRRKVEMAAGLVSGDSDSSALTQESGDEGEGAASHSERLGSVATGTEAGTEAGGDDDAEVNTTSKRGGRRASRTRGTSAGTRGKKRKR